MSYAQAFEFTNFDNPQGEQEDGIAPSFGGQWVPRLVHLGQPHGALERQVHDAVHGLIGGSTGLMVRPETAAQDPIFWLHHANIDRLWERWLQLGGGRANPVNFSPWMNQCFTFFNERRQQERMCVRDVLNTTAASLNYRYDDDPSLAENGNEVQLSRKSAVKTVKQLNRKHNNNLSSQRTFGDTQLQVAMSVDNQEEVIVLSDAPLTLTVPFQKLGDKPLTNQSRLALNLEEIEYNPSNVIPYQIYINLPEGATANPESPYYLSNFCAAS